MSEELDQDDKYRELVEARHQLEGLLEHPGWSTVIRVLQEQADMLQQEVVFTPLSSADLVYAQEWKKGKLVGLVSVSATVEGMLADLNRDLEPWQTENTENGSSDD